MNVLITGGSRGIGAACARKLAALGADIAVVYAGNAEKANEVCAVIRSLIERLYGKDAADAIVVQYGGSMNDKNAAELLAQPDVDGGHIGGASLVAEKFTAIVNAASAK